MTPFWTEPPPPLIGYRRTPVCDVEPGDYVHMWGDTLLVTQVRTEGDRIIVTVADDGVSTSWDYDRDEGVVYAVPRPEETDSITPTLDRGYERRH